jgi:hypothetical protein
MSRNKRITRVNWTGASVLATGVLIACAMILRFACGLRSRTQSSWVRNTPSAVTPSRQAPNATIDRLVARRRQSDSMSRNTTVGRPDRRSRVTQFRECATRRIAKPCTRARLGSFVKWNITVPARRSQSNQNGSRLAEQPRVQAPTTAASATDNLPTHKSASGLN